MPKVTINDQCMCAFDWHDDWMTYSSNYFCISRDFADLVANNGLTNEDNVLSVMKLLPIKCRPTFQRCMTQVVSPLGGVKQGLVSLVRKTSHFQAKCANLSKTVGDTSKVTCNKKAVLSQRWPRDARYISRSWAVVEIWPFEIIQDGGVRHLEFVRIENSAIRSAVPENPTL